MILRMSWTHLCMRPSGSMCAISKPLVFLFWFLFFEIMIPSSSVGPLHSLSILNDFVVNEDGPNDDDDDGGVTLLLGGVTFLSARPRFLPPPRLPWPEFLLLRAGSV